MQRRSGADEETAMLPMPAAMCFSQVADLEPDGEMEGRVLKVRALMLDEQYDAAIADARALAEQHRGNHAVHEVCSLCWMVCLAGRTHVCRVLWHVTVNRCSGWSVMQHTALGSSSATPCRNARHNVAVSP